MAKIDVKGMRSRTARHSRLAHCRRTRSCYSPKVCARRPPADRMRERGRPHAGSHRAPTGTAVVRKLLVRRTAPPGGCRAVCWSLEVARRIAEQNQGAVGPAQQAQTRPPRTRVKMKIASATMARMMRMVHNIVRLRPLCVALSGSEPSSNPQGIGSRSDGDETSTHRSGLTYASRVSPRFPAGQRGHRRRRGRRRCRPLSSGDFSNAWHGSAVSIAVAVTGSRRRPPRDDSEPLRGPNASIVVEAGIEPLITRSRGSHGRGTPNGCRGLLRPRDGTVNVLVPHRLPDGRRPPARPGPAPGILDQDLRRLVQAPRRDQGRGVHARTIVTTAISWRRRRSFHERPVDVLPVVGVADRVEGSPRATHCGPSCTCCHPGNVRQSCSATTTTCPRRRPPKPWMFGRGGQEPDVGRPEPAPRPDGPGGRSLHHH